MMEDKSLLENTIALMMIKGVGSATARQLVSAFGSATAVMNADTEVLLTIPRVGSLLVEQRSSPALWSRVEAEMQFIRQHHVRVLLYGEEGYPSRLNECADAPLVLYCLGNANLDAKHIIAIVGTRNCTQYGRDLVARFVHDIKEALPDVLIVSGLALGIDVAAHKASLEEKAQTVGVVAHGLDQVYPNIHKPIARQMIAEGGAMITEYPTGTEPERGNFLARNRIIAGLSDAVLVAESKDHGGSLVTAAIAASYGRDVFAFPGRVGDERSKGCNRLIRTNCAALITCAQDFIEAMGWETTSANKAAIQQSIPFEEENLTPAGRLILDTLRDRGDLRLSQLSEATGLDHTLLLEELLDLEMNDKIRSTPSGVYQIR